MKTLEDLTPSQIVAALDQYIIGQQKAKKAVAIALRNRMRRQKLPEHLIDEVAPKNIIMMGPTGVGKTEIARRLSRLTGAPFIKVEATKYTEVGYVGRDVESMVRDLMMVAVNMVKDELQEDVREEATNRVEDQILDLLLPVAAKRLLQLLQRRELRRSLRHKRELIKNLRPKNRVTARGKNFGKNSEMGTLKRRKLKFLSNAVVTRP